MNAMNENFNNTKIAMPIGCFIYLVFKLFEHFAGL